MYKHFVPPVMILTFATPIGLLANELANAKEQNVNEKLSTPIATPKPHDLNAAQVEIYLELADINLRDGQMGREQANYAKAEAIMPNSPHVYAKDQLEGCVNVTAHTGSTVLDGTCNCASTNVVPEENDSPDDQLQHQPAPPKPEVSQDVSTNPFDIDIDLPENKNSSEQKTTPKSKVAPQAQKTPSNTKAPSITPKTPPVSLQGKVPSISLKRSSTPDQIVRKPNNSNSRSLEVNSKRFGGQEKALHDHEFLTTVGGVDFEAVAKPGDSLKVLKIELSYDNTQPDGCRLSIFINDIKYKPFIPDWVLIPTVLYASSDYTSIVSLFGERSNTTSPNLVVQSSAYNILYHKAMLDTLLGLRMLQSDILLMDLPNVSLLGKNNTSIIGVGEKLVDDDWGRFVYIVLQMEMQASSVQSWVLTDFDVDVAFNVVDGRFSITGLPYYYFWKVEVDKIKTLEKMSLLSEEVIRRLANFMMRRLLGIEAPPDDEIKKILKTITSSIVIPLHDLTDEFRNNKQDEIRSINPLAVDTSIQMMRYAAFFRYAINNSSSWNVFYESVKDVVPNPYAILPSELPK